VKFDVKHLSAWGCTVDRLSGFYRSPNPKSQCAFPSLLRHVTLCSVGRRLFLRQEQPLARPRACEQIGREARRAAVGSDRAGDVLFLPWNERYMTVT
jgi:hypothetical protein